MKILRLFTFVGFSVFQISAFCQEVKTFQGAYENGTATYQYYENDSYERMYHGNFKYKGTVADDLKGKLNFTVTGQYRFNRKDGKWTYILADPAIKGATEIVTGSYANGKMDGEWTSVTTLNNTKKTIKNTSAIFKENKLAGDIKFDYTAFTYKEYASISIKGSFTDSSLFNGTWLTTYTKDNVQYEEIRKYNNGVLYLLLSRRLSDGEILQKLDSTDFVTRFFANYDPLKKAAIIGGQRYIFRNDLDKYTGSLELPIVPVNYWTQAGKNFSFTSVSEPNLIFLSNHGYTPVNVFHEKKIINWKDTPEGQKEAWQKEQDKKATDEKFNALLIRADSAFKAKLYAQAIPLYKTLLQIRDDQFVKGQIQIAQQIIDQEVLAKEQEYKAREGAYRDIISKADAALNEKKYDLALELYQSSLTIKDDQYPKGQITTIKMLQEEEARQSLVKEMDNLLVTVESGTFKMGCLRTDVNCSKTEEPVHEVYIKQFQICKYEVTVGQYKVFCKLKGKKEPEGKDNLPVTNVSWNDAVEFATWLGYRLPTESEWEYTARGGLKNRKTLYSGSNDLDEVSWYSENASNSPHPVGTKQPNMAGTYDMTGNVWEWCSDWYAEYKDVSDINPQGPASGTRKVKRGGSFSETNFEMDLRLTNRGNEPAEFKSYNLGMRLVKK
jgi:formylglycine-generating enzyme